MLEGEARHRERREQLTRLLHPEADALPLEGLDGGEAAQWPQPSPWQVIVLMLSMAHALDGLPDQPGGQLGRARQRSLELLLAGGEGEAGARELLEGAQQAVRAVTPAAEPPDPAVCLAWLALLEEEVDYLQALLRE